MSSLRDQVLAAYRQSPSERDPAPRRLMRHYLLAEGELAARRAGEYALRSADEFTRAGGDAECSWCGLAYRDHHDLATRGWLSRLCDGRLVKL